MIVSFELDPRTHAQLEAVAGQHSRSIAATAIHLLKRGLGTQAFARAPFFDVTDDMPISERKARIASQAAALNAAANKPRPKHD